MRRTTLLAIGLAAGLVVVGGAATAITIANTSGSTATVSPAATTEEALAISETPTPSETAPEAQPVVDATAASLLFMIEEEKLAQDVYVTLGNLWGSNIFSSIARSETSHQEQLLPLLAARGITDPRSTDVGVFVNDDLQALYDQLIAQGSVSRAEAMQVGIAIETKDINDIAAAVAVEDEPDVIVVYERLLSGSENHLAAFQRQA